MALAGNLFNLGLGNGTPPPTQGIRAENYPLEGTPEEMSPAFPERQRNNGNNNNNYGNNNNNNGIPVPNQMNRGRTIDPTGINLENTNVKLLMFTIYSSKSDLQTPISVFATMGSVEDILSVLKDEGASEYAMERFRTEIKRRGWTYRYSKDDTQIDYILRSDLIETHFDPNSVEANAIQAPVEIAENLRNIGNVFNARNNGRRRREIAEPLRNIGNVFNAANNNNNPRGGRRKKTRRSKKSQRRTRRR